MLFALHAPLPSRARAAACAGLLALAPVRPGPAPHPGPPVYLQVEVAAGEVVLKLSGEQKTILPWIGQAGTVEPPLSDERAAELLREAEQLLARANPITIDGARVAPVAREVTIPEAFGAGYGQPTLFFSFALPCEGLPRSVGIVWERFEGIESTDGVVLPVLFRSGSSFEFATLTPEEPEHVWRAPPAGAEAPPPRAVRVELEPARELPLASLGAVATALVVALVLRARASRGGAPSWSPLATLAAGAALALALRGVARVELSARPTLPTEEQALAMFETLHRGIYDAFSAGSEEEIYARLANSVDARLLDALYADVYESLILRGEGGAVCRVEQVEVLDSAVELAPAPPEGGAAAPLSFAVDLRWRVHGLVTHWGHQHRRVNQYSARYTVGAVGDDWRIVDVLTSESVRVADEAQGAAGSASAAGAAAAGGGEDG